MTALILVVDDIPANVKLLEAKLNGEYYDVITAKDGLEAISMVKQHKPDLILLDVMMPGMDGFETCRHLKADKEVSHIPVVMVTALSEPSDRVQGLEAGADDFITKPINDTALFARVRSLVRMKVLMDELRLRDKTGLDMGVMSGDGNSFNAEVSGAHVVVIDDDVVQCKRISEVLGKKQHVTMLHDPAELEALIKNGQTPIDVFLINTHLTDVDGLRLATHIKSNEAVRHVPIIMLVDEEDTHLMLKGLELGINDYLVMPIDYNEMQARVKTQIRRKRYQDALKSNYQASISMAITDKLTGLYNRHYLDTHLTNMVRHSLTNQKSLSLMIMDMDHFKSVNDTFGHDVGDEVLKQLAQIIIGAVRSSDLAARFGGEEFVVLLPESDFLAAYGMADRVRRTVEEYMFRISHPQQVLNKTLSIGVSTLNLGGDTGADLIKRADSALYEAKHGGRNQVMPKSAQIVQVATTPVMAAPVMPAPVMTAPAMPPQMPPAQAYAPTPPVMHAPQPVTHAMPPAPQPQAPQPYMAQPPQPHMPQPPHTPATTAPHYAMAPAPAMPAAPQQHYAMGGQPIVPPTTSMPVHSAPVPPVAPQQPAPQAYMQPNTAPAMPVQQHPIHSVKVVSIPIVQEPDLDAGF